MLPFCGYHFGDYFRHWLEIGRLLLPPPRIYSVNWFRRWEDGRFMWPGFGENMRVLKWVVERCEGNARAAENALGMTPRYEDLDWRGLDMSPATFEALTAVNRASWQKELKDHRAHFSKYQARLPKELNAVLSKLERRIA